MRNYLLFCCLLLWTSQASAESKKFAHDVSGRLISTRCGSSNPEFACPPLRAWDGKNCIKIPVVERCLSHGGEWRNSQYIFNHKQSTFLDICKCPEGKAWNGVSCTNTNATNICYSYNKECIPVHIRLIKQKIRTQPIISCEQFSGCDKKKANPTK